jgi:hypothetical protein
VDLSSDLTENLRTIDWTATEQSLDSHGYAILDRILEPADCEGIRGLWARADLFRSTVVMGDHVYGEGEYRYFASPIPAFLHSLLSLTYPHLLRTVRRWHRTWNMPAAQFPPTYEEFADLCRANGQTRPTPLLLRYQAGNYNSLHQDNYGKMFFPLQIAILLSRPIEEFSGGDFVLLEERHRGRDQTVNVVPLHQGDAVIFPNRWRYDCNGPAHERPVVKHGVAEVRAGERFTLGLIFHSAR